MFNPPREEEYYAIANPPLVVPSAGSIHNGSGFCYDPTCPCHEDKGLIGELNEHVQNGEASPDDADRIYHGHTID
ncbi:MAG TPA: hypothetical protein VGN34_23885 [Ktedonobacteraceae bacterium]|jgi:hypothetical protein